MKKLRSVLKGCFYGFLIAIVLVGIILRCTNVDIRSYWGDEVYTSLRVAGYGYEEVEQELIKKSTVTAADLIIYKQTSPERGLDKTVQGLIIEEPQHTPIYYLLTHIWTAWFQAFGNPVVIMRSFSVFISLFSLPCLYWLCLELFRERYVGLIAVAMVSVSPFHLVYAQDARPSALWSFGLLISSTLLLRSLRLNTKRSWVLYAVSIVFNLYTFLFSVFFLVGHGIYVAIMQRFRLTKVMLAYLLAAFVGLLMFLPWLFIVLDRVSVIDKATTWASWEIGSVNLLKWVLNNLRDVFFNIGEGYVYLTFLLFLLILFSLYFLVKNSPKSVWVFVFSLISVSVVALVVPDLISGKARSIASRLFVAPYLGIHLSIAYLFCTQISAVTGWLKSFWQATATGLLLLGVISCMAIAKSDIAFHQTNYSKSAMLARTINKYEHPLILASARYAGNIRGVISLSQHLNPDTQFQFVTDTQKIEFPKKSRPIFIYGGDTELILGDTNTKYKSKLILDAPNDTPNKNCCAETLWYLEGTN